MVEVGDKVMVVGGPKLYVSHPFKAEVVQVHEDGIVGERWTGVRVSLLNTEFRKLEPNIETELRLCESRRGILCKRIGEDQEEKKSLEKRIQELQQAIKERDKPKGRVGIKDPVDTHDKMYAISGDGRIWLCDSPRSRVEYRPLGNLFYDKESAERAVHDRKQRVLRGEDV
tara:strand:+ start:153 stop:665 length:513 start_codon:yes stop_codon:yes gene_type:complete